MPDQLVAFFHEASGAADKEESVDFAYLDFSRAFNPVSHCVLEHKLVRYVSSNWTRRWVENWLDSQWSDGP